MKKHTKALVTSFLALCLCISLCAVAPQKANAEVLLTKILATTSTSPVVLMEVGNISAATSTEGCYVGSITWFDPNGLPASGSFENQSYRLEICLNLADGYVVAADTRGYINNEAATVTYNEAARTVTLSRDIVPLIWLPSVIKHPGGETVTEGGWASFVATATYTTGAYWSLVSPQGVTTACADIGSIFPELQVNDDGAGKLLLSNIPYEMNNWRVMCTFIGVQGNTNSNGATIYVNADPSKPHETEPVETAAPTETPAAGETETEKPQEEHTHEFSTQWSFDESGHWHECQCGEKNDAAAHTMQWTTVTEAKKDKDGVEKGSCIVCGYTEERSLSYVEGSGANILKIILWSIVGIIGVILIIVIAETVAGSSRRRKRRKRNRRY